ncbi:MAG TPA: energy transducer TonB, partial [Terriglobales bacterium]|nr:energy transducer TonB [Terriglobales bacterium]
RLTPRMHSYKVFGCRVAFCQAIAISLAPRMPGQKAENESAEKNPRKLVYKVEPQYPAELKRAYIGGTVRLDVMISPRGTVQTVSVAGGNPVLAECAAKAIKQWKYTPADAETSVRLNVKFDPRR